MEVFTQAPSHSQSNTGVVRPDMTAPSRRLILSFALLCLLGVAVSVELTRIHVFVHTDPSYHSICAMSEGVNCETVAVSPYAVFAGLPVSVWGIVGYVLMGVLGLWACSKRRLHFAWPFGLLLYLTVLSLCTSLVLALISVTRIDSVCLFCMASYAINAGLLALALVTKKQLHMRGHHLLALDVKALASRPLVAVPVGVVGLMAVILLQTLITPYWKASTWVDLPKLASGTDDHGHHWIGARAPRLTIVEFSDYQCPHCRAAHKDIRILAAEHPSLIRLVHRQMPLDMACHPGLKQPFHTRACLFAEAAECAGLQAHFWEMNDALFAAQEKVKTNNVDPMELAVRLGLNRSEFKQCLETHATALRIANDVQEAMAKKLRGTPSFLVGERVFLGRIPAKDFERLMAPASAYPRGDYEQSQLTNGTLGSTR